MRIARAMVVGGLGLAGFVPAGCDERGAAVAPAGAAAAAVGHGVVRGTVKFVGAPPEMKVFMNEPCCPGAPKELSEETVVVGAGGGMANTVVWLKDAPAVTAADGAGRPAVTLDQKFCRFEPHVVAVEMGQTLHVMSSDKTLHNVHWTAENNPPGNFGLSSAGAYQDVAFTAPEFMHVRCDVHPWMSGTIAVMGTPLFAVTKDDGTFEITGVPAGTYTVAVWQEKYGELERKVTVTDDGGKPAVVGFEYKAPG